MFAALINGSHFSNSSLMKAAASAGVPPSASTAYPLSSPWFWRSVAISVAESCELPISLRSTRSHTLRANRHIFARRVRSLFGSHRLLEQLDLGLRVVGHCKDLIELDPRLHS